MFMFMFMPASRGPPTAAYRRWVLGGARWPKLRGDKKICLQTEATASSVPTEVVLGFGGKTHQVSLLHDPMDRGQGLPNVRHLEGHGTFVPAVLRGDSYSLLSFISFYSLSFFF